MTSLVVLAILIFLVNAAIKPTPKGRKSSNRSSRKKYKTYKSRGSSSGYYKNFSGKNSGRKYIEDPNPNECLVYMIENSKLNAIKVGIGSYGRVAQFLNSHVAPDYSSENAGWQVLRIAKFSTSESDYSEGRKNALEAEKRAHFYWRYVLQEPRHLEQEQMGYSLMDIYMDP